MPEISALGRNIAAAIAARPGWTLKELSRRSGVQYSTLHDLVVSGNQQTLRSDRLELVAKALDLSPNDLLGLSPSSESEDELTVQLERSRRLGFPATLIESTARQAARGQMPESERQRVIRNLRNDLDEYENRSSAAEQRPAPAQMEVSGRQARGGVGFVAAHASPAPTQPSRQEGPLLVHGARAPYGC